MLQMDSIACARPPVKFCKKKRSSASMSSDSTEVSLPPPTFDNLHDKILKKERHLDAGELILQTEKIMGKRMGWWEDGFLFYFLYIAWNFIISAGLCTKTERKFRLDDKCQLFGEFSKRLVKCHIL